MTSGKKLPELYTIIISINSFLLPLWWLLTPLAHVVPPWCSSTSTAFCKSRVIFAWGDVTYAAYSEPNDCVLLSAYRVWLRSLNRSSLPSSRIQRIKDPLLCAPQGAVGRRAALPTPISKAFLPAVGAVHTSAGPEGHSEGCRAARGEERRGKTMGARPDGKTLSARAEHLLPLAAAPALPQAGTQPSGVPCRATAWRRHSAPLPHRGFLMGKAHLCQRPALTQKPNLSHASSHAPMTGVPCSSHAPPRRGQAWWPCMIMP